MTEPDAPSASSRLARWPLWQDLTARRLLFLGLLAGGLHFILVAILLPRLPATVPLHMDGAGVTLLSGPPTRLFLPPLFGLLAWLANGALGWFFHQRRQEPDVAYLLWGAALAVQLAAYLSLRLVLP